MAPLPSPRDGKSTRVSSSPLASPRDKAIAQLSPRDKAGGGPLPSPRDTRKVAPTGPSPLLSPREGKPSPRDENIISPRQGPKPHHRDRALAYSTVGTPDYIAPEVFTFFFTFIIK